MQPGNQQYLRLSFGVAICSLLLFSACQPAAITAPTLMPIPSLTPSPEPTPVPTSDCSAVERLPNDSVEAAQITEELIRNFKAGQPTEYMGLAVLDRVDRLGEWAVVQGSVSGDDKDILVVRQTSQGYQLAERYLVVPSMRADEGSNQQITHYFLEKLPGAPEALFTCLEPTWLSGGAPITERPSISQLAYIGSSDFTTQGMTEIHTVQSDGSNPSVILSEPMLIMGLVSSPDGERIAFWGCPGSLSSDCSSDADLDIWSLNWDGSDLRNLTEDSSQSDSHPDWSPDGRQIAFDSDRSGNAHIYIMNADGGDVRALTNDGLQNTEPKWSPDGKWIAYHCRHEFETRICVLSPDGQATRGPFIGALPVWSPVGSPDVQLAFLCFQQSHSDICTARPDGSNLVNLTDSPEDEHSPAWSPDGNWLAFVSNRDEDVDIYKVCVTCPDQPAPVRLTDEPREAGWPAWSPDGNWVAYADGPGQSLMLVKADRSEVTFLAGGVFGPPIWRP